MRHPTAPPAQPFEEALVAAIPALHRFATYLTRDPVWAEDLMQETYARALAHREQFALGTDCRAWLFKIAHNLHRKGEARALEASSFSAFRWGRTCMRALDRPFNLRGQTHRTAPTLGQT